MIPEVAQDYYLIDFPFYSTFCQFSFFKWHYAILTSIYLVPMNSEFYSTFYLKNSIFESSKISTETRDLQI